MGGSRIPSMPISSSQLFSGGVAGFIDFSCCHPDLPGGCISANVTDGTEFTAQCAAIGGRLVEGVSCANSACLRTCCFPLTQICLDLDPASVTDVASCLAQPGSEVHEGTCANDACGFIIPPPITIPVCCTTSRLCAPATSDFEQVICRGTGGTIVQGPCDVGDPCGFGVVRPGACCDPNGDLGSPLCLDIDLNNQTDIDDCASRFGTVTEDVTCRTNPCNLPNPGVCCIKRADGTTECVDINLDDPLDIFNCNNPGLGDQGEVVDPGVATSCSPDFETGEAFRCGGACCWVAFGTDPANPANTICVEVPGSFDCVSDISFTREFLGHGTACVTSDIGGSECPTSTGACCRLHLGGGCTDNESPAECVSDGGLYMGRGSVCGSVSCPPPEQPLECREYEPPSPMTGARGWSLDLCQGVVFKTHQPSHHGSTEGVPGHIPSDHDPTASGNAVVVTAAPVRLKEADLSQQTDPCAMCSTRVNIDSAGNAVSVYFSQPVGNNDDYRVHHKARYSVDRLGSYGPAYNAVMLGAYRAPYWTTMQYMAHSRRCTGPEE